MMTLEKIDTLLERKELPILQEKNQRFYICDYCRIGILIKQNSKEQDGGEVILPSSLTGRGKIKIAAHNRCIKNLIKELEQMRK